MPQMHIYKFSFCTKQSNYILLLIVCLFAIILFIGCKPENLRKKTIHDLIVLPEIHDDQKIFSADSLQFIGQDDLALELYFDILESKNIHQVTEFYLKSKILNISEDTSITNVFYQELNTGIGNNSFFPFLLELSEFELRTERDLTQVDILRRVLNADIPAYYKGKAAFTMAKYFDERMNDLDSAWHYIMLAKNAFEETKVITPGYQECLEKISAFCTYKRKNLLAIRYANKLFEFDKYLPATDSADMARAYANRAFMMFREGDMIGTEEDIKNGLSLISPNRNPELFQNLMKSYLVIYMLQGRDSLWHSIADKINQNIRLSGNDYIEMNRWYGQYYTSQGKYEMAIPFLKLALNNELKKGHNHSARFSTLCFLLSQCYEISENYDEALNYIAKNIGIEKYSDAALLEYLHITRTYPFVAVLRCAEIYHAKYKFEKSNEDIWKSKKILDRLDDVIFTQFKVMDENAILQFYLENGQKYFELGMDVNYSLWKQTKDTALLHAFVQYSDKHNNSLLYRDKQMAQSQVNIPEKILQKEISLRSFLKDERRKGLRDNTRFNALMDEYYNNENERGKINKRFITHGLVTEKLNIADIKTSLHKNQTILSIDETKDFWYYTVINQNEVWVDTQILKPQSFRIADTLIAALQSSVGAKNKKNITSLLPSSVRSRLKDTILYIPDGMFHRFPLEILLDQPGKKIIHLPAIRLLADFIPHRNNHGKTVLFAFSGPNSIRSKYRTRLIELPGTYKEINALKSKYPKADIYTGTTATKTNFLKAYQDASVQYMHLALHGIANSAEKDDVKLYFRTSYGGLDSLYGYELLRYKSKCKKIVLSACQSGLGSYVKGEGLFSLPRYFMINGATDVTFNYWDVED